MTGNADIKGINDKIFLCIKLVKLIKKPPAIEPAVKGGYEEKYSFYWYVLIIIKTA